MSHQRNVPSSLTQGKRPGTHCAGAGWAPGPVWKATENIALVGIRCPGQATSTELSWPTTPENGNEVVELTTPPHRDADLTDAVQLETQNSDTQVQREF
jgi:hypothetical protein